MLWVRLKNTPRKSPCKQVCGDTLWELDSRGYGTFLRYDPQLRQRQLDGCEKTLSAKSSFCPSFERQNSIIHRPQGCRLFEREPGWFRVGEDYLLFFSSQTAMVLRLTPKIRETPRCEARSWQAASTCCLNTSGYARVPGLRQKVF